jgi:ribosomal protein S27E
MTKDEKEFIETSGNIHIYRVLKVLPEGTWTIGDKVHNSTLYDKGYNIVKLVKAGYIKNIDEPYDWQKGLVDKNEHSVYVKCGQCGSWGVNFPLDVKCANCGYEKCITYYDAQTIDVLINSIKSQLQTTNQNNGQ